MMTSTARTCWVQRGLGEAGGVVARAFGSKGGAGDKDHTLSIGTEIVRIDASAQKATGQAHSRRVDLTNNQVAANRHHLNLVLSCAIPHKPNHRNVAQDARGLRVHLWLDQLQGGSIARRVEEVAPQLDL